MNDGRIFKSASFLQSKDREPIRSVVTESSDTVVVAWYVKPNQKIAPHVHSQGRTQTIMAGGIVIAPTGCVHGVANDGKDPLVFISTVSSANSGYQTVSVGA